MIDFCRLEGDPGLDCGARGDRGEFGVRIRNDLGDPGDRRRLVKGEAGKRFDMESGKLEG